MPTSLEVSTPSMGSMAKDHLKLETQLFFRILRVIVGPTLEDFEQHVRVTRILHSRE